MGERVRVRCINCEQYYWIELTDEIDSILEGEAFECRCPYCEGAWAQFPKEEEKK